MQGHYELTADNVTEWFKESFYTENHLMRSFSILPRESVGVVDEILRAYKVEGMRVVDADKFPLQT